jgi:hypothetical protein
MITPYYTLLGAESQPVFTGRQGWGYREGPLADHEVQ